MRGGGGEWEMTGQSVTVLSGSYSYTPQSRDIAI
jgi:hypothetical protein